MDKNKAMLVTGLIVVVPILLTLIFGGAMMLGDLFDGEGDEYVEMFMATASNNDSSDGTNLVVFDLVTGDVIEKGHDSKLMNAEIFVNVTDKATDHTEGYTIDYNGYPGENYIELPYGEYYISADFPGTFTYRSCHLERNINVTHHTDYVGEYEWRRVR